MGTFSDTFKNAVLDQFLKGTAHSYAGQVWAKLHIGDPGSAGTSNPAAHTTRVQCTLDNASGGNTNLTSNLDFASLSANETISWLSFWDASTGGDFIGKDDLPTPRAVLIGDTLRIPAGDIDFSF